MEIFLLWIVFSVLVGIIGSGRNIGFLGAFFLSLLLSPLIGLVFTLLSVSNVKKDREKMIRLQEEQAKTLKNINQSQSQSSVATELEKLIKLKNEGILSEDEYERLKQKLLA